MYKSGMYGLSTSTRAEHFRTAANVTQRTVARIKEKRDAPWGGEKAQRIRMRLLMSFSLLPRTSVWNIDWQWAVMAYERTLEGADQHWLLGYWATRLLDHWAIRKLGYWAAGLLGYWTW